MAKIIVDQRAYDVDPSRNLLAVCLSLGFNLPYFCWHPAMGSVGACRQCAVKQFRDEKDAEGRLVMACMTPAAEGTRISIEDPEAKAFRASIIEWLMVNHPHDCPVCDEGGECHLQDMTVMAGHTYRRYRFKKRTYRNQYLGPFIKHDMNRCIQCYRCVRFYRDYAGGRDFDVFASHNHVYFGRHEDGVLENEFSGNLVEVCPTGVFTDNTLMHHYTRKWDLQTAQSICPHCSLGCNTTPGERYGILRRITNRYNSQINGYFICDRGRFGYGYVNQDIRIRRPMIRTAAGERARPEGKRDVLQYAAALLSRSRGAIGIGSPRASLEANFALRTLIGPDHFHAGISERESRLLSAILGILRNGPVPSASIRDVETSDAVLVLGEDVLNSAPRLALALLQSIRQQPLEMVDALRIPRWDDAAVRNVVQDRKGPLFIADHRRTWLHDYAADSYFAAPDDIARLGFATAHAIDARAPDAADLPVGVRSLVQRIADALRNATHPLVLSGTSLRSEAVIRAAANVAWALHRQGLPARLCFAVPDCNSLGLALMGGKSLESAFGAVRDGTADTVIILENDLYRREDRASVEAFLTAARQVIVLDYLETDTTAKAHAIFSAAAFPESDGTVVNNEGRAQRFYQVFVPEGEIHESWRWLRDLAQASDWGSGGLADWRDLDDVVCALSQAIPAFQPIRQAAPPADFRLVGKRIPRQPERYSGRTAMWAHLTVHEPVPPEDPDSPLAFSMEGYRGGSVPSPLIPQFWAPGWNSIQALNKFQDEVGGPLREEIPGVRLIEPVHDRAVSFFTGVPHAFHPRSDEWLLLPLYHLFGSEELSIHSPSVAERIPKPYLALNPDDAAHLQLQPDAEVTFSVNGRAYRMSVRLAPTVPRGTAGFPVLPASPEVALPVWSAITRASETGVKRESA